MMNSPTAALTALRASTADLIRGVEDERWTDVDVRAPSLLPGWSRGHVLTHIARNADGIGRAMSGALRGEIVERYPTGRAGRDADIEAGAGRSSVELLADVRDSADRLDRILAAVADVGGWDLPTEDRSCGEYVLARWREVEVHRLDLGGTYTGSDWPPEFVAYLVPELAETVADRADTAIRIEVAPDGSLTPDLSERTWASSADPGEVVVRGPDWAVLAWLVGRPAAAGHRLTATPPLGAWL
jgi:maleylpyruvate isomerase